MSETPQKTSGKLFPKLEYRHYVLCVLLIVFTFSFIDRQIIAVLSPAIKEDLGLNDTQLGFLKGFAFALFYASFGIPIARLADKHNRVTIITLSLAAWSAMTALCGAAGNFAQLALARIGVGVGEAGCSPPAHSIISDYFAKDERATAIGIYSLGIPIGTVFGFLAGGWLVGELGWRWAFAFVGLPGVLFSVLVKLTVKEPVRGSKEETVAKPVTETEFSVKDSLSILWKIKSFRILTLGAALSSFSGYALGLWVVDFFVRTHGFAIGEITVPLAIVLGIGGGIGAAFGGAFTDHFAKKDQRAVFSVPAVAHLLATPLLLFAVWSTSSFAAFVALFPFYVFSTAVAGPFFALVQNLAPVHMRSFASAIFFFALNALGFGLGPLFVGILSDALAPSMGEALSLQWGLTAILPFYVLSSLVMLFGRAHIKADLDNAARQA